MISMRSSTNRTENSHVGSLVTILIISINNLEHFGGNCHPCVCGCTNKGVTLLAEAMICFCCKQSRPVIHRMSLASLKRNGFKRVIKGHSNLMGGSCFQHLYYSTCSSAVEGTIATNK